MPISENIANGYLQLGIAGAALLIVLVNTILNSRQGGKLINASNEKVDKLCDKIDSLVTTITKEMVISDKDQKETNKLLKTMLEILLDLQKKVVRIDDRTYSCLGSQKGGEEN